MRLEPGPVPLEDRETLDFILAAAQLGYDPAQHEGLAAMTAVLDDEHQVTCLVFVMTDPEDDENVIVRPLALLVNEQIIDRLYPGEGELTHQEASDEA